MSDPQLGPALAGAVDLSGLVNKNQAPSTPSSGNAESLVRDVDDRSIAALVELSRTVPVILEVYGGEVQPVLGPIIESYQGRFVLGTVRGESSPELVRALQIEGIPTVLALIGGQPVPLFKGIPAEQEVRAILDQVLTFAQENGVTGQVDPGASAPEEDSEPQEAPLPPLHQEAFDALTRNDLPAAKAAYQKALQESPADADASAGLAQVELLERARSLDAEAVRRSAADDPGNVDHALAGADLDMSGGHIEDAFVRLLGIFAGASDEDKERIRERLLNYFTIVGQAAPEVKKARTQLASLMF